MPMRAHCSEWTYTDLYQKRRVTALPHRMSPKSRQIPSAFESWNATSNYITQPAPPTITPVDSDSDSEELAAAAAEPRSFFSPYSSPFPSQTVNQSSPSPFYDDPGSSQTTQMSMAYSEDMEMTDSMHLSPGSFHNDAPSSLSGRIPTPIHSSFGPRIRDSESWRGLDPIDDETLVDRFRRGRRLPSPISEGEPSPSTIIGGFEDMQMEVDHSMSQEMERETPTKKGHHRSKHSVRAWVSTAEERAPVMKRSFSMGYRADCEKCRQRVPGHFSHIITY